MNKSFLVALALGAVLSACSSHPSDHTPSTKVSLDQVPPGSRDTDIYNLDGSNPDATKEGHEAHGAGHGEHGAAPESKIREDVMPNHDEHKSDIGGNEQVPAEEKTTDAENVENHE
jgi:hypothetical protein